MRPDPTVTKSIKEQRPRQPVLEAAGRVSAFVLEVKSNAWHAGQRHTDEMRVGRAIEVGVDELDRVCYPGAFRARALHGATHRHDVRDRPPVRFRMSYDVLCTHPVTQPG